MPKTFRPYAPEQMLLLPSSVQDWVPEGDMAHFISDIVDALDLSEIEAVYEEELRGYPPYHPRMMTKLCLYAYAVGTRSCRKLAKLAQRDVGVMMLAAGNALPGFAQQGRIIEAGGSPRPGDPVGDAGQQGEAHEST
jgi:transposase